MLVRLAHRLSGSLCPGQILKINRVVGSNPAWLFVVGNKGQLSCSLNPGKDRYGRKSSVVGIKWCSFGSRCVKHSCWWCCCGRSTPKYPNGWERKNLGSSCSSTVDRMPDDRVTVGSNLVSFSFFPLSNVSFNRKCDNSNFLCKNGYIAVKLVALHWFLNEHTICKNVKLEMSAPRCLTLKFNLG